jgi:hypothetical protein
MATHQGAAAAIEGLDDKFQWPGMTGPMVVNWMDSTLQRQRRWVLPLLEAAAPARRRRRRGAS